MVMNPLTFIRITAAKMGYRDGTMKTFICTRANWYTILKKKVYIRDLQN